MITCLCTYRGVPDLEKAGICYTKDVVYLRGLRLIEDAATRDEAILDQLAVGKIALELLPYVQEDDNGHNTRSLFLLRVGDDSE